MSMEIIAQQRCFIGEGPIWNEFNRKLYQVGGGNADEILEIDICKKEVAIRKLPFCVAAMAFTKQGEMIVSCLDGVYILHDDNSRTPLYDQKQFDIKLCNDSKVGPDGRFYFGTQSKYFNESGDEVDGKLYSIDKDGKVKILLDGLILSNGFDWSMDEKRLYHTDSDTGVIKEYNFDKESGEVTPTGRQIEVAGVDGITIDQNDLLYVACWGYSHIAVVDTANMQIKEYINIPTQIPASCCFAGENMDNFVVVTSTLGIDLEKDEKAGFTFVSNIGAKGRKPFLFG